MGLGLLLAYAAGGILAWRLWPLRSRPVLLLAALAWPLGLAVTSSAYFLLLVVSGGRAAWYPWLEVAGVGAAAWLAWRARRERRAGLLLPARPRPGMGTAALLVLVPAVVVSSLVVLRWTAVTPWGYWDALARINVKAAFLHRGGPDWTWIFHGDGMSLPDYPLLLECSVARLWLWSGGVGPLPAQMLSVLNWVACLAAVLAMTGRLRSTGVAVAAGLAFLCSRADLSWAGMQYADFSLATYLVWCAGFLVLAMRRRERAVPWLPLVGACAASAAWCKNEGLVFAFFVVTWLAVVLVRSPERWRAARVLCRGILPCGVSVVVLKLAFAGKSFVFAERARPVWEDLTDLSRYEMVGGYAARHLAADFAGWELALVVLALLLLPRGPRATRSLQPLVLCLAMALVLLLVLVTTHFDLEWLASTTVDRFVLQLWPLAILGLVSGLRSS